MIDLYTWDTPNGRKVSIALEEMGLAYEVHPINIEKGEQFAAAFLEISPNNKIPAIADQDNGLKLMESGAILQYLADKTGRLWPSDGEAKWRVTEWLMWQMGGFGPMLGQANHFVKFNPGKSEYATARYRKEAERLYGVLDRRLTDRSYVADEFSIADIAIWCWTCRFSWHGIDLNDFGNVMRWYLELAERPAFQKGFHVPNHQGEIPMP